MLNFKYQNFIFLNLNINNQLLFLKYNSTSCVEFIIIY